MTRTVFFMSFAQSFGGLFGALLFIPFRSNFYKTSQSDTGNGIINREVYLHIGKTTMFIILLILVFFLPLKTAFMTMLITSGVVTMGFSFLVKDKEIGLNKIKSLKNKLKKSK